MKDGKGPVAVALLALAGACIASFVIGTPPGSRRGVEGADAFLTAWRDSRNATFVVAYKFTRTLSDGNHFEQSTLTVQQPPNDRIISGLGTVAGRLGGKIVRCASAPDGTSRCFTAADAAPYPDEVDQEIAGLRDYVQGARPLYRVVAFTQSAAECFRLDLALQLPSPPFGEHALFCFDPTNHAPTLTVIERPTATDRTEALAVRTTVTADDLRIPADFGSALGLPGPTTTTTVTTTTVPPPTTTTAN